MRGGRPTDRLARANLAAQPAKGDVALCGLLLGNHCSFQSLSLAMLAADFLFTLRFTDGLVAKFGRLVGQDSAR
jgi:hypothetical protein